MGRGLPAQIPTEDKEIEDTPDEGVVGYSLSQMDVLVLLPGSKLVIHQIELGDKQSTRELYAKMPAIFLEEKKLALEEVRLALEALLM
ncbi:hypothetical protein NDU88_001300 [Pleurodeles waltl]|uniref:Uncharacterized protein n=1 Tax=Pleurodeles waltl TaxID=8319 RepID=A0AAV7Q6N3_PLEWA|nr:hypothetical protein NDU88_001300 [Pleurodeles waltl]